jgi:hypothetical protein
MPACVGLVSPHFHRQPIASDRHLGPWDVEVDREETRRSHEEVVREHGINASDSAPALTSQDDADMDLLGS